MSSSSCSQQKVDSIVVLSGIFDDMVNLVRSSYELYICDDRMVEAAILVNRYCNVEIAISDGTGAPVP